MESTNLRKKLSTYGPFDKNRIKTYDLKYIKLRNLFKSKVDEKKILNHKKEKLLIYELLESQLNEISFELEFLKTLFGKKNHKKIKFLNLEENIENNVFIESKINQLTNSLNKNFEDFKFKIENINDFRIKELKKEYDSILLSLGIAREDQEKTSQGRVKNVDLLFDLNKKLSQIQQDCSFINFVDIEFCRTALEDFQDLDLNLNQKIQKIKTKIKEINKEIKQIEKKIESSKELFSNLMENKLIDFEIKDINVMYVQRDLLIKELNQKKKEINQQYLCVKDLTSFLEEKKSQATKICNLFPLLVELGKAWGEFPFDKIKNQKEFLLERKTKKYLIAQIFKYDFDIAKINKEIDETALQIEEINNKLIKSNLTLKEKNNFIEQRELKAEDKENLDENMSDLIELKANSLLYGQEVYEIENKKNQLEFKIAKSNDTLEYLDKKIIFLENQIKLIQKINPLVIQKKTIIVFDKQIDKNSTISKSEEIDSGEILFEKINFTKSIFKARSL